MKTTALRTRRILLFIFRKRIPISWRVWRLSRCSSWDIMCRWLGAGRGQAQVDGDGGEGGNKYRLKSLPVAFEAGS